MADTDKMAEIRDNNNLKYIYVNLRASIFPPNILNSQKLSLILCPLFPERNVNFFKTI